MSNYKFIFSLHYPQIRFTMVKEFYLGQIVQLVSTKKKKKKTKLKILWVNALHWRVLEKDLMSEISLQHRKEKELISHKLH